MGNRIYERVNHADLAGGGDKARCGAQTAHGRPHRGSSVPEPCAPPGAAQGAPREEHPAQTRTETRTAWQRRSWSNSFHETDSVTPQLSPGAGLAADDKVTGVASGDPPRPCPLREGLGQPPGPRHHAPMGALRPPPLLAGSGGRRGHLPASVPATEMSRLGLKR